jgi:hypothetical protein
MFIILSTVAVVAHAEETNTESLSWLIGFESANGGDPVGALVNDGQEISDVETTSGMHVYGGVIYRPLEQFEGRITAGYFFDRGKTEEGEVFMDRITLELLPTYPYKKHRLGVGVTYHINPTIDGEDFDNPDVEFRNSLGFVSEYGYKLAPFLYLGVRYVFMKYDIDTPGVTLDGKRSLDADHFGINLYFEF